MFTDPASLAVIGFIVAICGKLIWNIWSELRREAKDRAESIRENSEDIVETKVKTAVLKERVDGHEKRIDHLEDERPKQNRS